MTSNATPRLRWTAGRFDLDLTRPRVMGIVNITPDSFSDGGLYLRPRPALDHCRELVDEGADLLDLGAESTRPGAAPVSAQEEWRRLLPVLAGAVLLGVPVSVDTSKPEVMQLALEHGADIVNDVRALRAPGAIEVVSTHPRCGVCLMHMRGEPATMQADPRYDDVVAEVRGFLAQRVSAAGEAGIGPERIVVDPGFGFGKTVDHNLELLRSLPRLQGLGAGVMSGWSRKSSLAKITGREPDDPAERVAASVAAALASVQRGARIVRVHDVAATVDAVRVWQRAGLVD